MPIINNPSNTITGYFCYLHKRADGRIFYVGKGTYERAISLAPSYRNKWHGSIVAKEGKENIIIELIPAIDEEDANRLEILNIAALRPYFELCNFTDGGEGRSGCTWTEEQKASKRGKPGYKWTQKQKDAIKGHPGCVWTEKQRKAHSERMSGENHPNFGKTGELSPNYGIPFTEKRKRNISIARTGQHPSEETKRKICEHHIDQSGENAPWTNLTWKQVREIRKLYFENSLTQTEIARQFDMTASNIWCIIHNKSWKE